MSELLLLKLLIYLTPFYVISSQKVKIIIFKNPCYMNITFNYCYNYKYTIHIYHTYNTKCFYSRSIYLFEFQKFKLTKI